MAESHDKRAIATLTIAWCRDYHALVGLWEAVDRVRRGLPRTMPEAEQLRAALDKFKPSEAESDSTEGGADRG